ncbi:MAG: carboxypeptidase regulatory-like domain-containing protein [Blastocatellia bacterium]|nr:carboxypeptidase regulatory-like domain-containing protein [Blastocatellia bacterium]
MLLSKIRSLLFIFAVLTFSWVTQAQTATATLKGIISDGNDQVLSGATVTLTNAATGLQKTFVTDEGGHYSFTFLVPGTYAIEAQAQGFKISRKPNVILEVGQTAEFNLQLAPGDVAETVNITATEPVNLDTTTSALGGIVGRQRVEVLPLNGRNVFQLAQLEIGVASAPGSRGANPDLTASGEISINGGRTLNTEAFVDGIPLANKGDNRISLRPSPDAVQEFQIVTNSFPAEYGRTGGGALNFSTRSGSTEFRATLFEYLRNDAFDARSFFVNANPNGVKEKLRFNQFGGNVGGPVWLPGVGKSKKLFFFFNYEALRISQTKQTPSAVPTAKMRSGDFSELLGATIPGATVVDTRGQLIPARIGQIYVPGTVVPAGQPGAGSRVAFADNIIPDALINPVGRAAVAYFPLPNAAGVRNANGLGFSNNYIANTIATNDSYQITARVDYNLSSTQQIFWRIIKDQITLYNSGPFPTSIASPIQNPKQTSVPGTHVVNYVNTLSSKVVLHLNAGMTRFNNDAIHFSRGFDVTSLGLPAYVKNASDDTGIFPTLNPAGYTSLGPPRNFGFYNNNQDVYSLNQDVSWLRGNHALKFGANERIYRMYNYRPDDPAGNFTFARNFTQRVPVETTPQTGDAIAALLLGNPASGRLAIAPQPALQSKYYAAFVQDDWKVNERLTLNLGLRWEFETGNTERFNRLLNFDDQAAFPINHVSVAFPDATGLGTRAIALRGVVTPVGRGGVKTRENYDHDYNNFGPRVGLAYKLNEKTVIRSGGAILYAPLGGGGFNIVTAAMDGLAETPFIASLNNGISPVAGTNLSNPFPSGIVAPTNDYLGPLTGYGRQSVPVRLRNIRQPFIAQWNLNVQRELPGKINLEVAYAGNAGIGLLSGATDINQLSPEAIALASKVVNGVPLGNLTVTNPFLNLPTDQRPASTSILGRSTVTVAQLLRPYPQFGNIVSYSQNESHSTYHSLQLTVARRVTSSVTFSAAYSFSKLIDDLTSMSLNNQTIQVQYFQDYHNRRADKSLSNFDVRHRFIGDVTWQLPFGREQRFLQEGVLGKIIGGFAVNTIVQAQSGFPLSISATNASVQGLAFNSLRPNIVGNYLVSSGSKADRIKQYFNTTAFAQPVPYSFGNTPRTLPDLRSPSYLAANFSLQRDFKFTEHTKLQIRAEAFNLLNRANFQAPGTTLGGANFGVITTTEDPRQVQFAARLYF